MNVSSQWIYRGFNTISRITTCLWLSCLFYRTSGTAEHTLEAWTDRTSELDSVWSKRRFLIRWGAISQSQRIPFGAFPQIRSPRRMPNANRNNDKHFNNNTNCHWTNEKFANRDGPGNEIIIFYRCFLGRRVKFQLFDHWNTILPHGNTLLVSLYDVYLQNCTVQRLHVTQHWCLYKHRCGCCQCIQHAKDEKYTRISVSLPALYGCTYTRIYKRDCVVMSSS